MNCKTEKFASVASSLAMTRFEVERKPRTTTIIVPAQWSPVRGPIHLAQQSFRSVRLTEKQSYTAILLYHSFSTRGRKSILHYFKNSILSISIRKVSSFLLPMSKANSSISPSEKLGRSRVRPRNDGYISFKGTLICCHSPDVVK